MRLNLKEEQKTGQRIAPPRLENAGEVIRPKGGSPRHPEAFKVFTYECMTCGHQERIWNSRDGATPFIVGCLHCGREAKRVSQEKETQDFGYTPKNGERYFIDMTIDMARQVATNSIDRFRGTEYERTGADRLATIDLVAASISNNGISYLVTAGEGIG